MHTKPLLVVLALPLSLAYSARAGQSSSITNSNIASRRRGVPEVLTTQMLHPEVPSTVLAATMGPSQEEREAEREQIAARKQKEAEKAKAEAEKLKREKEAQAERARKERELRAAKEAKLRAAEAAKKEREAQAIRDAKAQSIQDNNTEADRARAAAKAKKELEAKKKERAKLLAKAKKAADARRVAEAKRAEAAEAEAKRAAAAAAAKAKAVATVPPPPTTPVKQSLNVEKAMQLSVLAVLSSSFLNLLGFTMAGPITPALGKHFGLSVGASFGSLTSAYPLGMLLGLFLWPPLSDKIGRKPVLAISLLGSGIGLAAQSYVIQTGKSLGLFLATRILTGSFAGASAVAKAYLADVGASKGSLPRYLALRDAAATMAFIVGPIFGGIAFDVRKAFLSFVNRFTTLSESLLTEGPSANLSFVIAVSSFASLVASVLVTALVRDIPEEELKTVQQNQKAYRKKLIPDVVACPLGTELWAGVASVCVISFLFNVGDSTFHAFFSALMRDSLNMSTRAIGLAYTMFACVSFTVSTTLSGRSVRNLGPVATCAIGLALTSSSLGLMSLQMSLKLLTLGAAALYYCGVPLYGPTIPTMLLRCVPPNKRGAVMGLDGAINTVARVISPLIIGTGLEPPLALRGLRRSVEPAWRCTGDGV